MTAARAFTWALAGVVVVAGGRQIAYALTGGSLAARLSGAGGGPDVVVVGAAALGVGMLAAIVGLWLLACGVRERCQLELEGWARTPPTLRARVVVRRTIALSGATVVAFTAFESTLHYEEGLGFHGWHCIAGPVHQNAAPILAGLSLVAAACVTGAEFLLAALRRAVARLLVPRGLTRKRAPRRPPLVTSVIVRAARGASNLSRGPPPLSIS
jgi:hypothetical protein